MSAMTGRLAAKIRRRAELSATRIILLTSGDLDSARARWQLRTSRGDMTADVVIAAAGPLSTPSLPDIPGLGSNVELAQALLAGFHSLFPASPRQEISAASLLRLRSRR